MSIGRYLYKLLKLVKGEIMWVKICKNWYEPYFRYLLRVNPVNKITYNFKNFKVVSTMKYGDFQVVKEVFVHDYYLNEHIDFRHVKNILDLGAQKGFVSILYASVCQKCKIVALEPEENNCEFLKENIKINHLTKKVIIEKKAVWKESTTMSFYKTDEYTAGHSLIKEHLKNFKKSYNFVDCVTIPWILKKHNINKVDLLKIDIEGAEYEVLFNLDKTLLKKIKYLLIECHPYKNYNSGDIISYLEGQGFSCHYVYEYEDYVVAVNNKSGD